jgi:hypothetical protein
MTEAWPEATRWGAAARFAGKAESRLVSQIRRNTATLVSKIEPAPAAPQETSTMSSPPRKRGAAAVTRSTSSGIVASPASWPAFAPVLEAMRDAAASIRPARRPVRNIDAPAAAKASAQASPMPVPPP